SDFRRIPQPQLHSQLRQQPLEPGIVPASFHPHTNRLPRQRTVKLLRLFAVEPFFLILPRFVVKDRDLLKPRMKITAYNQHDVGSFSVSLGRFFAATNVLAAIEPTSLCNQARTDLRASED